jgi:hypothetical protein
MHARLLTLLWALAYHSCMTLGEQPARRPDVIAADRGGDPSQGMTGEADLLTSSMQQAVFWRQVYAEILAMEEKVMARVNELMAAESPEVRREVELSNVPVIAAQVERFRRRHDYWDLRVAHLTLSPLPIEP